MATTARCKTGRRHATGRLGQAFSFDGVNDGVTVGHHFGQSEPHRKPTKHRGLDQRTTHAQPLNRPSQSSTTILAVQATIQLCSEHRRNGRPAVAGSLQRNAAPSATISRPPDGPASAAQSVRPRRGNYDGTTAAIYQDGIEIAVGPPRERSPSRPERPHRQRHGGSDNWGFQWADRRASVYRAALSSAEIASHRLRRQRHPNRRHDQPRHGRHPARRHRHPGRQPHRHRHRHRRRRELRHRRPRQLARHHHRSTATTRKTTPRR